MSSDVCIIIPTFGNWDLSDSTTRRAVASADKQTVGADMVALHRDTLAQARNEGAAMTDAEWLVFLDADDELAPDYVEKMLEGESQLRQPATLGVYDDGHEDEEAVLIPARHSIREANWFVIGTMISHELFDKAEGFWDEPAWEDWSLILRCFALHATWECRPEAVYRVHVSEGRNQSAADNKGLFQKILLANDQWANARGMKVI